MDTRKRLVVIALVLALTGLPYLLAASGSPDFVFGGFLLNPLDGYSYLAKMQQGYRGQWAFTLPFTAEPGAGASIFLFYLALGHLARLLRLPLILVFHLARLAGAGLLAWMLFDFFRARLPGPARSSQAALLAAFGSGIGWLALPFLPAGGFTTDMWVAETYPFLSAFANPHFPLALAAMLWLMARPRQPLALLAVGFLLANLLPFAAIVVVLALGIEMLWGWLERRALPRLGEFGASNAFLAGLGALPVVIYQLWLTANHPQLAAWNAQNVTLSPAWWDLLLSFSPALPLAAIGAVAAVKKHDASRVLVAWAAAGLVLVALPFALQRRFMLGLYIPLAGLAVMGIDALIQRRRGPRKWLFPAVLALSVITNLFLLVGLSANAATRPPLLYLTRDEAVGLDWIKTQTRPDALILAPGEMGAFIPAFTGRRVIYGHPFETVNAAEEKAAVDAFFAKSSAVEQFEFLSRRGVDFVFYSCGDESHCPAPTFDLPKVAQFGSTMIYDARP